jgi:hypothetical protein
MARGTLEDRLGTSAPWGAMLAPKLVLDKRRRSRGQCRGAEHVVPSRGRAVVFRAPRFDRLGLPDESESPSSVR